MKPKATKTRRAKKRALAAKRELNALWKGVDSVRQRAGRINCLYHLFWQNFDHHLLMAQLEIEKALECAEWKGGAKP